MKFKRLKIPSNKATSYLKNDNELSQYWEQLNRDCYGEIIIDSDTLDHIGHVFVWHTKKNKGFIFNLEVKPQYRRQGYGWILLDDAVKKYDGIDLLVDEDNIPAIKLYEKYGFETIKTVNGQLWMKLNQIKQEGVIMFFDRLGNSVTGEPKIVEEPVVESYYDPNRPVRPGFEKPQPIQEEVIEEFYIDKTCDTYEDCDSIEESVENIVEYSEMDIDEMSDYIQENVIMEANEASKKARKNVQEFMRREYGTAYPTSMTSKQRNRMKRWLKDNDYDPKTGTIATDMKSGDGKAIRVNLGTNSAAGKSVGQKSNMPFYATANPFYPEEKYTPVEQHAFAGGRPLINMPKEYMKRHPSVSTGISKHEEGHLADYYGKIDDVVDRRIEAGEHITQSMKKGMDYSPTHTDVKEHIADLYSVQHNKYKDKLRFLNAFLSEDIHMQRKFKANWKDLCKNIYKKQSDDQPPIIDASSVETMRDSIKNMVSRTKANIKSYKAQLKTPLYQSGKNLLNRLIASGKDACDEYEKILRKWFIGKLLFKKVDYDDAKVMVDKAVWHDAKLAVDEAIRQSDGDIEIRREFLKKYINEFAIEYDMSITDVIQEMYLQDMEDYVFQEDYEEDEFVSREIILEEKISAAERDELDDDDFGLVYTDEDGKKVRKYPLTDENHIRQAVRFFSHCPDEHKPQLARKILKKANEHDMDTSNWGTIHEWAKK